MRTLPDLDLLQAGGLPAPDQQAVNTADAEAKSYENARLQEEITGLSQDRGQRKQYSNRLFWLVVGWLFAVGAILILHGFNVFSFHISDTVLITLISTTTASVLGLFVIVVNYLFTGR